MFTSMESHYTSSSVSTLGWVTYLCLAAIGMGSIFSLQQYHIRTNSLELGLLVIICIALLLCTNWHHVLVGTLVFLIPTVTILLRISIYDLQNNTEFSFDSLMASVVGSTLALCLLVLCWAICQDFKKLNK